MKRSQKTEKISLLIVGLTLVVGMITAGPAFSSAFAKDSGSDSSGGSSDHGSGDSGGSSDHVSEAKPSHSTDNEINNPQHPGKEDTKDISDIPAENGSHCLSGDCPKPNFRNGENPIVPTNPNQPHCMIPEGCPSPNHPPIHFPPFVHCGHGFSVDHGRCERTVIVNIIHHSSGSSGSGSSGSSHSLSAKCFDSIKIAWVGKIHRGENHDVDKIIDDCLNL